MDFFGQIDLTALGQIVRNHPECVKTIQKKDGTQHQYLNINVSERKEPDQFGRTHYVKPGGIPKANQKQGINYFIADLKPSQQAQAPQPQQAPSPQPQAPTDANDLPF